MVNKLNFVGIQAYTIINGELYIILGKESYEEGWSGSETWSSFGGRPNYDVYPNQIENALDEAIREFDEESMGIFGSKENIREKISKKYYLNETKTALSFFLFIEFEDPSNIDVIVDVFKNIYLHFAQCTIEDNNRRLRLPGPCYDGFLEKTDLGFFKVSDLDTILVNVKFREEYLKDLPYLVNIIYTLI